MDNRNSRAVAGSPSANSVKGRGIHLCQIQECSLSYSRWQCIIKGGGILLHLSHPLSNYTDLIFYGHSARLSFLFCFKKRYNLNSFRFSGPHIGLC